MFNKLIKKVLFYFGIPNYFIKYNLFEFRLLLIRLYNLLPIQHFKIKKLENNSNLKLNFGCGDTSHPSWVGIDSYYSRNVDLLLDLRRNLPFSNSSVSFCYSEHFLEHLYPEEGLRHLKEVYRILKPNGVYRVVVPAGIRFVEKYLQNDIDFFKLAFPWEKRPIDAVYNILNWGGEHRNIFDYSQLAYMGKLAGFNNIIECESNKSHYHELRIDNPALQRIAESIYIEFKK